MFVSNVVTITTCDAKRKMMSLVSLLLYISVAFISISLFLPHLSYFSLTFKVVFLHDVECAWFKCELHVACVSMGFISSVNRYIIKT
jgi:hypothetical protein